MITINNLSARLKKNDKALCMLSLILVFAGSADTMMSFSYRHIMYYSMIFNSALLVTCLMLKKRKIEWKLFKIVVVLLILVFVSMFVNADWHGYSQILVLIIAFLFVENVDYFVFWKLYDGFILVISIFSLAVIVMYMLFPTMFIFIANYLLIVIGNGDNALSFVNLGVTVVPLFSMQMGVRNYGLFREPAMFCIYVGLALGYNLYSSKISSSKSLIKILIYLVTILTTWSVTGFVAVAFLMTFYLLFYFRVMDTKEKLFWISVLLIALLLALKFEVFGYLYSRIQLHGPSEESVLSRVYSVIGGVLVAIINPFFGIGATNSWQEFDRICNLLIGRTVMWANHVTYYMASYGCIYILIFLGGVYKALKKITDNRIAIVMLVFVLLLLCGEVMTYSSLMFILMLYGYKSCYD
ncbi:hypothetical protein WAA20_17600 [Butyrivibrio fibrisolvens]|nr:hypothetical protein [Butyrivibrio fibrisolvens]